MTDYLDLSRLQTTISLKPIDVDPDVLRMIFGADLFDTKEDYVQMTTTTKPEPKVGDRARMAKKVGYLREGEEVTLTAASPGSLFDFRARAEDFGGDVPVLASEVEVIVEPKSERATLDTPDGTIVRYEGGDYLGAKVGALAVVDDDLGGHPSYLPLRWISGADHERNGKTYTQQDGGYHPEYFSLTGFSVGDRVRIVNSIWAAGKTGTIEGKPKENPSKEVRVDVDGEWGAHVFNLADLRRLEPAEEKRSESKPEPATDYKAGDRVKVIDATGHYMAREGDFATVTWVDHGFRQKPIVMVRTDDGREYGMYDFRFAPLQVSDFAIGDEVEVVKMGVFDAGRVRVGDKAKVSNNARNELELDFGEFWQWIGADQLDCVIRMEADPEPEPEPAPKPKAGDVVEILRGFVNEGKEEMPEWVGLHFRVASVVGEDLWLEADGEFNARPDGYPGSRFLWGLEDVRVVDESELKPKPIEVGDIITPDRFDELPLESVVFRPYTTSPSWIGRALVVKTGPRGYLTAGKEGYQSGPKDFSGEFRVLQLGQVRN